MPRLLSKKEPTKISEVKVEKKFNLKVEEKPKQKSLRPEGNMSAWEYYNFLMRFGKRKMTRIEWVIWKMKKDEEDLAKGRKKPPLKKKMSSAEYNWRLKKDPDFNDIVAREEFGLDINKNGAWC